MPLVIKFDEYRFKATLSDTNFNKIKKKRKNTRHTKKNAAEDIIFTFFNKVRVIKY